jgi:membrane protein DedA with SNARE-associated domain
VQRGRPSRIKLRLLVAAIVVTATAGTIATALTGPLATRHPLLLIVLDARNRNLILARHVSLVPFLVVGTFRRVLSDPLYWLLGWWYGDRAIRWLEHKGGGGVLVTFTERVFTKAAYPMVFLFPGVAVCSLAGATGMPFIPFLIVNVVGTLTTVSVLRLSGDLLGRPVDAVLGLFSRHVVATTVVTVSLVVVSLVLNRLQGGSDIPPIDELERDPGSDPGDDDDRQLPNQPR